MIPEADSQTSSFLVIIHNLLQSSAPLSPYQSADDETKRQRQACLHLVLSYLEGNNAVIGSDANSDSDRLSNFSSEILSNSNLLKDFLDLHQIQIQNLNLLDQPQLQQIATTQLPDLPIASDEKVPVVESAAQPSVQFDIGSTRPGPSTVSRPKKKLQVESNVPINKKWSFFIPAAGRGQRWQEIYRAVAAQLGLPEILNIQNIQKNKGVICCLMQSYDLCEMYNALVLENKIPKVWFTRFFGMSECCEKVAMARYLRRLIPVFDDPLVLGSTGSSSSGSSEQQQIQQNNNFNGIIGLNNSDPGTFLLPERIPETFILPDDWQIIEQWFESKRKTAPIVIVKPEDGSQGDGIFLCNKFRDLQLKCGASKRAVVQKYIKHPLLLGGLKFDFRIYIYVLGLGSDRQRIFVCREGLARFCTVPYENPSGNSNQGQQGSNNSASTQLLGHLTNYSLNKRSNTYVLAGGERGDSPKDSQNQIESETNSSLNNVNVNTNLDDSESNSNNIDQCLYVENEDDIDDYGASKRRLSITLKQIKAEYPDFDENTFWRQIDSMALQWITCFNPVLQATHRLFVREREATLASSAQYNNSIQTGSKTPRQTSDDQDTNNLNSNSNQKVPCAQVLGFDVLLGKKFKCHLLEVNNAPSLALDEVIPDEIHGTCKCMEHHKLHRHDQAPVDVLVKSIVVKGMCQLIQLYEDQNSRNSFRSGPLLPQLQDSDELESNAQSTNDNNSESSESESKIRDINNLKWFSEVRPSSSDHLLALSFMLHRIANLFHKFPMRRGESMTNPFSNFGLRKVLAPILDRELIANNPIVLGDGYGMSTAEIDLIAVKLKKDLNDGANYSVVQMKEISSGRVAAQMSIGNVVSLLNEIKIKKKVNSIGEVLDALGC